MRVRKESRDTATSQPLCTSARVRSFCKGEGGKGRDVTGREGQRDWKERIGRDMGNVSMRDVQEAQAPWQE